MSGRLIEIWAPNKINLPDVRIFARPSPEGLELAFRLTHPSIEEVELTKGSRFRSGIAVYWIISICKSGINTSFEWAARGSLMGSPFVMFNKTDHVVLFRGFNKGVVVGQ